MDIIVLIISLVLGCIVGYLMGFGRGVSHERKFWLRAYDILENRYGKEEVKNVMQNLRVSNNK